MLVCGEMECCGEDTHKGAYKYLEVGHVVSPSIGIEFTSSQVDVFCSLTHCWYSRGSLQYRAER